MQLLIQLSVISACTIRQSPSSHVISQSCSYSPTQPPMLHLHAQSCATASTPNHILPIHNDTVSNLAPMLHPHPQPCSHQPSYIHIHNHAVPTSHALNPQSCSSQPPNAQPDKSKSPNAHNPGSFHPTIVHMHHQAVTNLLWSTCSQPYTVPNLPCYVFTSACTIRKL